MELMRTKKGAGLVANDSLRSKPYSPPSESLTVWYASVFAAAMVYSSQVVLLLYRRLDISASCLVGAGVLDGPLPSPWARCVKQTCRWHVCSKAWGASYACDLGKRCRASRGGWGGKPAPRPRAIRSVEHCSASFSSPTDGRRYGQMWWEYGAMSVPCRRGAYHAPAVSGLVPCPAGG